MSQNPYEIELADVAIEIGANLTIEYYTATIKITLEQLKSLKENGFSTKVMECIAAGLMLSGKTEEETLAFLEEANNANGHLSVSFDAPEGGELNVKSQEENPMLDQLVLVVENNQD